MKKYFSKVLLATFAVVTVFTFSFFIKTVPANAATPTYTITYNANGATGGIVPVDSIAHTASSSVIVLGNTGNLVKTGWTFSGWNTLATGLGTNFVTGSMLTITNGNVILYAKWTAQVTYNANSATGGTVPTDANSYVANASVTVLNNTGNLAKTGWTFARWNTKADGSGTSQATSSVFLMSSGNVTLYAQWTCYTDSKTGFSYGDGSVNNPYQICNWPQLNNIRNNLSSNYILTANLSSSNPGYSGVGNSWTPIGSPASPFTGSFVGNDHVISNVIISQVVSPSGFFGSVSGKVFNLILNNITVNGGSKVGGLAGLNSGLILGSCSTGNVSGSSHVGGLVGTNTNTISKSCSGGNVTQVGYYGNGSIEDAGGLVGENDDYNIKDGVFNGGHGTITDSYSTANATAVATAGGLVGNNSQGTIKNSYSTGVVATSRVGDSEMMWWPGGLVGDSFGGYGASNSFWDTQTSGLTKSGTGVGKTTVQMKTQSTYVGWDFNNIWNISSGNYPTLRQPATDDTNATKYTVVYNGNGNTGGVVPSDPGKYLNGQNVTILGVNESFRKGAYSFAGWNTKADGSGNNLSVNSTFTVSGNVTLYAQWVTIPSYSVVYNGNGNSDTLPTDPKYYLSGDKVTVLGFSVNGFVGWNTQADGKGTNMASSSTFVMGGKDIVLYAMWNSAYFGGGDGSVSNPYQINNWSQLNSVRILPTKNFILTANLSSATPGYSGIGSAWTPIASFSGNFDGNGRTISDLTINLPTTSSVGFVSSLGGTISNLGLVNVNITGETRAGAFAGSGGTVSKSYSTGKVSVSAQEYFAAGIIGYGGTVSNSYSTVNVSGIWSGGLIGASGGVTNSYFAGKVSGSADGGLVGYGGYGSNSYWDTQTSGQTISGTGVGKTTAEMKTQATFAGWDFVNTWKMSAGGYPTLNFIPISATTTTYTVTYNGNGNTGGTVPVDSIAHIASSSVTVLGNTGNLVKTGYTFAGWNTSANGSGVSRPASSTFLVTGGQNITLYAKWGNSTVITSTSTCTSFVYSPWSTCTNGTQTRAITTRVPTPTCTGGNPLTSRSCVNNTYTVTYNGNGNYGGEVDDVNAYAPGASVTVLGKGPLSKSGSTFAGWNTKADGSGTSQAVGSTFAMPSSNVTMYAQWTVNPACTSYTYSDFTPTTCPSSGFQTRTVTAASPAGCVRNAVLTQSCTPATTTSYVLKTIAGNDSNGDPMGVIQKSPDKDTYGAGEVVTLTAVPSVNYKFLSWKGGVTGSVNPQTITMTSDKTVAANFGKTNNILTVVSDNGTVTKSPDQTGYDYGTAVTLTAVPNSGYSLNAWTGGVIGNDNYSLGNTNSITVYMNGDRKVWANFMLTPTTATTTSSLSGNQNYATAAVGWDTFLKLLQALR